MTLAVIPTPPLKRKWVPLSSALGWVCFDQSLELADPFLIARERGWSDDELRHWLTSEWRTLSDYASEGAVRIRARQRHGHFNVELTTDDLQNFRYVGWERGDPPALILDRFPFTFAGGFQHRASELRDGFLDPTIWRDDLITYKRLRSRIRKSPRDKAIYALAEAWLHAELSSQDPHTGSRKHYVEELTRKFGLPQYHAQQIWTKITRSLGWPERGRPLKNSKSKTRKDSAGTGIFSGSAD